MHSESMLLPLLSYLCIGNLGGARKNKKEQGTEGTIAYDETMVSGCSLYRYTSLRLHCNLTNECHQFQEFVTKQINLLCKIEFTGKSTVIT